MTDGQMYDSAIRALVPNAQFARAGGKIIWDSSQNNGVGCPSEEQIIAKQAELQADYDAKEYARNREVEYPPMEDQLDYMFHNGFDKWKEDIVQPVKDKYPKPE